MHAAALLVTVLALAPPPAGSVPPLTDEQRMRLDTAFDGRDHREEAFVALLENLRAWTGDLGDVPVRLTPDFDTILVDPGGYRGQICRIRGTIHQQRPLPGPYGTVAEWFVRDASGRPVIVYVVGLAEDAAFADGQEIEIDARFYKRVDAEARDGVQRSYPALVGALPRALDAAAAPTGGWTTFWMTAAPVLGLLVIFVVLRTYVRRMQRRMPRGPVPNDAEVPAEAGPLPSDPAEALAELRRRAQGDEDTQRKVMPDAHD